MSKSKWLQMRLTEEDDALLDALTEEYGLDRSNLIRKSLEYIFEHRPIFQIVPQGKGAAPTGKPIPAVETERIAL